MTAAINIASLVCAPATRLTVTDLRNAANPIDVRLDATLVDRVEACSQFVSELHRAGTPIYGLTTGFGPLVAFSAHSDPAEHGLRLVRFLQAGQGDPLPAGVVRAMLLARLWSLTRGHSGVATGVVRGLREALATDFVPIVPELGSVGASGDLCPLAHAVAALLGEGEATVGGERVPAATGLARAGLRPLELEGRDALALVNGTSLTAAGAGLAVEGARRARRVATALTALLVDLLGADPGFADPDLVGATGHESSRSVALDLSELLRDLVPDRGRPLQEVYSVRCAPQLLGAVEGVVERAVEVIEDDLNGVSDNPVFFPELGKVVHGGNFFGQPVAFAADALTPAIVQMANLAERQLDLLMDPARNGGRPPCLAARPGETSGLTGTNIATTAIVATMRRTAVPASVQSLPTNLHNQDIVPFGTQAAMAAYHQVEQLSWVHGAVALALRQAAHLGKRRPTSPRTAEILRALEDAIEPIDPDRETAADVRLAADVVDAVVAGRG